MIRMLPIILLSVATIPGRARADEPTAYDRKEDVVYGRKFGTALTMDVFTPRANANGAAVIWVVSGGWYSGHEAINTGFLDELLRRGYTVFAVVHGSQPKYTIPEILHDMHRAVRFIRPTDDFPQIRLRFTPAAGKVYGASRYRHTSNDVEESDPIIDSDDLVLYDPAKGSWRGYRESGGPKVTPAPTSA